MLASPNPTARGFRGLYLILGLAVVVGVIASVLATAAPAAPAPVAGQIVVSFPPVFWGLLILSPLLVGLAAMIYRRLTEPVASFSRRSWLGLAVMLVLCLIIVYAVAALHPGSSGTVGYVSSNPPPTSPPTNGTPPKGGGGTGGSAVAGTETITLTMWTFLAIVAGISACVVALAVPGVISRLVDRSSRSSRPEPSVDRKQVHEAFAEAGAAIDQGGDPRETVVRLYVRLLGGLAPKAGDVACLTADEIRVGVLEYLGVDPTAARELTRLFEEARYSTHPMGPGEARRCRETIVAIERGLARGVAG